MRGFIKKVLSITLVISLFSGIVFSCPVITGAASTDGTCGDSLNWSFNSEDGTLTISGSGEMYNYEALVNSSTSPWKNYNESINKIIVESGVLSIGEWAFSGCVNLSDVIIEEGLRAIGYGAFRYCSNITGFSLPDSISKIEDKIFDSQTNFEFNTYDNGLYFSNEKNPYVCFAKPVSDTLPSCDIHPDTRIIGNSAFNKCKGLASVVIPDNVVYIGEGAFSDCPDLTSVSIGKGLAEFGSKTLKGVFLDEKLNSITVSAENPVFHSSGNCLIETASKKLVRATNQCSIPTDGSVTSFGDYAFAALSELNSIYIPDCITDMGMYAFHSCSNLKEVIIGDGITRIGYSAFSGCDSLTSVTIPSGVTSIALRAFGDSAYMPNFKDVYYFGTEESWNTISIDGFNTSLNEVAFHYISAEAGDINEDGKINVSDVLLMKRLFISSGNITPAQTKLADINGDGKVNAKDLLKLRKQLIGVN